MEKKIIVYGCSHSNGVGPIENISYTQILSEKQNLSLIKRYTNSFTNDLIIKLFLFDFYKINKFDIFSNLESVIFDFKESDIVIFQLTSWMRNSVKIKQHNVPILLHADYLNFHTNIYDEAQGKKLNLYRDLFFYFTDSKYTAYKTIFDIREYQKILEEKNIKSIILIWDEFQDDEFLTKIGLKNYIKDIFLKSEYLKLQNKHSDLKMHNEDLHLSKEGNEWLASEINNLICYLK